MNETTFTTRDGRQIIVISQGDLRDPISSGEQLRAFCHLHGSDHQRSLSIGPTGWGYCHACHKTVLVRERCLDVVEHLSRRSDSSLLHVVTSTTCDSSKNSQVTFPDAQNTSILRPPRPVSLPAWQQEECALLRLLECELCAALIASCKARAYLAERCIPLKVAEAAGLCYMPPEMLDWPGLQPHRAVLHRWVDRVMFPLTSPGGRGFIGRSLWNWQPCMDENQHKMLLDQPGAPRRWIKTNPAGWFGYVPGQMEEHIVLVEGGFDRLTLLTVGLPAQCVIALVGTAARPEWLASLTKSVVLALDGDTGGVEAMQKLEGQFEHAGFTVKLCPPLQDHWGKDWNERLRRIGSQCVWPLYEVLAHQHSSNRKGGQP